MSIEAANQAARNPIIKGARIEAGGYVWEMPPLNMRQLREYQDAATSITPGDERALFDVSLSAIHSALTRNYPGLTLEHCLDIIDAGNFRQMISVMNGVSGVTPSGEAQAVQTLTQ